MKMKVIKWKMSWILCPFIYCKLAVYKAIKQFLNISRELNAVGGGGMIYNCIYLFLKQKVCWIFLSCRGVFMGKVTPPHLSESNRRSIKWDTRAQCGQISE